MLQSLDAALTADSPHIALRPSGRGGLASRPQQLAPPPPPPKSPIAEKQGPLPLVTATKPTPTFVRPGGRGGIGSHANANTPPLTLKDILNRKKPKFGKKSKARARTMTTLTHPISSHLANEITNASTETLSTLHFAGESTSPPPSFFHEPQQSIQSASADDLSLTPPSSATASTFDGSLSLETEEDDLDINVYLEDAPSNLSPADRQQRSINKLTRTLGGNPYEQASGALTAVGVPSHNGSFPKILIDRDVSMMDKSTKKFRRASLSVSSIFGRPARIRDSEGLDSHSTIDTVTDDLHHLGLGDDMSESWGEVDPRRVSVCGAPESPILFSLPSPLPLPQTDTKRTSTLSIVPSLDSDSEFSVPSSTLSRSQSYSHSARRQSTRIGHNHSMSTSLTDHAFTENTSIASSVNWLFPPSNDDRDFKLLVTSHKHAEKPLQWTGEWNTDMDDVIRALRELRWQVYIIIVILIFTAFPSRFGVAASSSALTKPPCDSIEVFTAGTFRTCSFFHSSAVPRSIQTSSLDHIWPNPSLFSLFHAVHLLSLGQAMPCISSVTTRNNHLFIDLHHTQLLHVDYQLASKLCTFIRISWFITCHSFHSFVSHQYINICCI